MIPKYSLIAIQLLQEIREGCYRVGEPLPTETRLIRSYGASRHTARRAVQVLRSRKIVSSRQGQGSSVISDGRAPAFVEEIQSLEELIAFDAGTRRKLLGTETVEAEDEIASKMRCRPGQHLLKMCLLRYRPPDPDNPTVYVVVWMDSLFEAAVAEFEREPQRPCMPEFHRRSSTVVVAKAVDNPFHAAPGQSHPSDQQRHRG